MSIWVEVVCIIYWPVLCLCLVISEGDGRTVLNNIVFEKWVSVGISIIPIFFVVIWTWLDVAGDFFILCSDWLADKLKILPTAYSSAWLFKLKDISICYYTSRELINDKQNDIVIWVIANTSLRSWVYIWNWFQLSHFICLKKCLNILVTVLGINLFHQNN